MRICQQGEIDVSKPNVFIDVDDVILNSSDTVIDILNKKFNLHKTKKDLKDWGFKSITHECNRQILEDIFCSKEFWNNVTCKTELIEALKKITIRNIIIFLIQIIFHSLPNIKINFLIMLYIVENIRIS